jgi:hypothetical protein
MADWNVELTTKALAETTFFDGGHRLRRFSRLVNVQAIEHTLDGGVQSKPGHTRQGDVA